MIILRPTALALFSLLIFAAVVGSGCRKSPDAPPKAADNSPRPLSGRSVSYYPDGKKMGEAFYKDGVLDGRAAAYYPNGKKKSEASYKQGILDGKSTRWDEAGKVIGEAVFVEGVLKVPGS